MIHFVEKSVGIPLGALDRRERGLLVTSHLSSCPNSFHQGVMFSSGSLRLFHLEDLSAIPYVRLGVM